MRLTPFALAFLLALPLTAQTTTKRPMTFADLQAMKRVSDPQISPSGKWVLFSVTDVSLEKNTKTNHLWLVPLDGSAKETQLTNGSGESNGRFSPDGKWIMYSASDANGSGQIFIAPWDDAAAKLGTARAVTALATEADGGLWAPDSQHFLFTSSVYPDCESKLPLGAQHNDQEANCNALKDALAAKNPVKAQIFDHLLYRHWNQYTGPKHSHIFYASIADISPKSQLAPTDLTPASVIGDHEAPTFSLGGPLGYAISPDGKEIAYVTNLDKVPAESTNNDIFTLQVGADPHTAKKVSTSPGSDDGPQYSPDGKWLAWRSQARNGYESDKFDLVVMDRTDGSIKNLTQKFTNWVDEFLWSADSKRIFFASAREGSEPIYSNSVSGDSLQLHTFFDGREWGEYGDLHVSADGKTLVGTRTTITEPAKIVALQIGISEHVADLFPSGFPNGKGDSATPHPWKMNTLSHLNDELLNQLNFYAKDGYGTGAFLPFQPFMFTGADGAQVQGFIVLPPNFEHNKKYPLKFLIHGGPQGAWGDAWSYRWNPELFAANGYVVVMINPRGSTGYGQKFLEQVSGDWGGRPYIDLMKGLDYAEKTYPFIDKTRECALGASYGGYMADWILTHTTRFACIVTHDGMYNPQSAFGTTEELWFNEWEFRPLAGTPHFTAHLSHGTTDESGATAAGDAVVEQTAPAHPWDFYDKPASEDPFRKWSPMLNIKNAKTPTLIIHGQKDYRLDVSEGLQLFTALQLLHVPSKMLYFPDEGHWVLKPQNSQLWYQTVNDWVDQWTHTNNFAK